MRPTQDDERPPICPACGVTMVPAALSAKREDAGEWVLPRVRGARRAGPRGL